MSGANGRQVGGSHYAAPIQHWDYVAANDLDYFQGQITKYVVRWRKKGGIQDLEKARHFLDKYVELAKNAKAAEDQELHSAVFDRVRERAAERDGDCDHDWDLFSNLKGKAIKVCVRCFERKPAGEGVTSDAR